MGHRPSWARELYACSAKLLTGFVDIGYRDREVTKSSAQGIGLFLVPIVGQLDNRAVRLIAVTDKGQREFSVG